MTFDEFKIAYQPLANKWPEKYATQAFRQMLFENTKEFGLTWVKSLVNKWIISNDPNFNFGAEIKAESRRRADEYSTSENAAEYERFRRNSTGHGLEAMKKQYDAGSAWEIVLKTKGKGA